MAHEPSKGRTYVLPDPGDCGVSLFPVIYPRTSARAIEPPSIHPCLWEFIVHGVKDNLAGVNPYSCLNGGNRQFIGLSDNTGDYWIDRAEAECNGLGRIVLVKIRTVSLSNICRRIVAGKAQFLSLA